MATKTAGRPAVTRTAAPKKVAARALVPKKAVASDKPSQRQVHTEGTDRAGPNRPVGHALLAAERAMRRNSLHIQLPLVGELHLPAVEEVAFIGGVAVLAVVGILEWPVAALLGLGHGLAMNRRNKVVRAFGEALEEA